MLFRSQQIRYFMTDKFQDALSLSHFLFGHRQVQKVEKGDMRSDQRQKSEPSSLQCEEEVPGIVAFTLIMGSVLISLLLFPLSMIFVIKVVQVTKKITLSHHDI